MDIEYPTFQEHIIPAELRTKFKQLRTAVVRKHPELYKFLIKLAVDMCYKDPQLLRNAYYEAYRPHCQHDVDTIEAEHRKWVDKVDKVLLQDYPDMLSTDNTKARGEYDPYTLISAFYEILAPETEDLPYVEEIANEENHEILTFTVPPQHRERLQTLLKEFLERRKFHADHDMALIPHTELLELLMDHTDEFYKKIDVMYSYDPVGALNVMQRAFLLGGKEDIPFLKHFVDLLLQKGFIHRAAEILESLVVAEPHNVEQLVKLGRVYQHAIRNTRKALTHYKAAAKLVPDPLVLCKIAECVGRSGDRLETLKWYQRAREVAPTDGKVLLEYTLFLEHNMKLSYEELLPAYEACVALEPAYCAGELARFIGAQLDVAILAEQVQRIALGTSDPLAVMGNAAAYCAGFLDLRENADRLYETIFSQYHTHWHATEEEMLEVLAQYHHYNFTFNKIDNTVTTVMKKLPAYNKKETWEWLEKRTLELRRKGMAFFEDYKSPRML